MRVQRSMAFAIGGVALLVLVGVALTTIAARRPEASFAPDSPEGTVATYLRLLEQGQVDEAYAMTALEESRSFPEPRMTREQFHRQFDRWSATPRRVTLLRTTMTGDVASVTVDIATFAPGPFGVDDRSAQQTFTLVRREGRWLITGPAYLYP
jgi:hypothetical protein